MLRLGGVLGCGDGCATLEVLVEAPNPGPPMSLPVPGWPVLALTQSGFCFVCSFSTDTGAGKHHRCQGLGRGDGAVGAFLPPALQGCVKS